ncbi:MAG: single-stranded DNA-binding protein [Gammaproteobacteria bacterium]|nr:single-stranded DNA-binding protein [Gammaproteobacteria bacterium]
MLNRVTLIGRLTADPELKYTPSGIAVANFTLAVERNFKQDGEKQIPRVPVVAWRQSAEFAANYLTKGRLVAVEGSLQVRKWTAQDGTKRSVAEVVADNVWGLDKPKEQESQQESRQSDEVFEDPFAEE